MSRSTYILCLLLLSGVAYSQGRNADTTIFQYENSGNRPVANSFKVKENPTFVDTAKMIPEMKYSIVSRPASPPVVLVPMKAAKMEGEPLKKLYHGYVKAGMGTYTTPLLDIRYNQLRSKSSSFGIHLKHISSASRLKDHGYAGWSDNVVEGNLKYFMRRHTLNTNLGYIRNALHFYGYNDTLFTLLENDYTKQVFNHLDLGLDLQSHYSDSSRLNHRMTFQLKGLQDYYKVTESDLIFRTEMGKEFNGHFWGGELLVDHLSARQDFIDTARSTILQLKPFVKFIGSRIRAQLGAALSFDISERNKFHFYPSIEVHYNVADHIFVPYAGAGGGLNRVSYRTLTAENPFMDPETAFNLRNTDVRIELYAGMRGALSPTVSYNMKVVYRTVSDQYFFVTDTLEGVPDLFELMENRFKLVYDTMTNIRFAGELKFRKSEKLSLLLKGEYNSYSLRTENYPWYNPAIKLDALFSYNLRDKIITELDVFYRSKQLAPVRKTSTETDGVAELKGYADVNLMMQYVYNKRLSVFLNIYNLGSVRYHKWLNYPSQRLQIMGGLTFSF